jgi:mannitol/fructose-specific phosphotransferase system IIA component (Ntr-type)
MLLSSLLDPELIKVKIKASTIKEAIEILLETLLAQYSVPLDKESVLQAILAREELGGTILPTGLSIPHARIDFFNDILIGFATLKTSIDVNGVQVRAISLILTSKTTSNLYLNCLSSFARISWNPELFSRIIAAQTSHEIASIIQQSNLEIRKELTVEHIMSTELCTIQPDLPVSKLIDRFIERNTSYIPVVNESMHLIGECSVIDVLRLGIPNYTQIIGNLNFLKTFEPLEELLDKEDSILVHNIMEPPSHSFQRSTSIVEAVSTFTKSRRRHVPVLDGQKIIGVLSFMDILRKVLRA